jgi:AcrR family transcriptional regulator
MSNREEVAVDDSVAPPDAEPAAARTRDRIQQVALELFAEHGYDGTSLRQIADRLAITKAALYYHFQSKDEIVTSVVTDMFVRVDALIAWAREQPKTVETRQELLRRYADLIEGSMSAMRFVQHPRGGPDAHPAAEFKERITALSEVLTPPDPTMAERGRAILAVVSLHIGGALAGGHSPFDMGTDVDPAEGRQAMLKIAMDLVRAESDVEAEESDRG